MLYLLDASVLIRASADYYLIDRVPEFWTWLVHQGTAGRVKLPVEIIEEIEAGGNDDQDLLCQFIKATENKRALTLTEEVNATLLQHVLDRRYGQNLTDVEIEKIGRDPFLVAYAAARAGERTVVTMEVSAPSKQRANRKLPDVCRNEGIACLGPFQFYRELGFSTAWQP